MIEPVEIDRREAIKRIFAIGATFSLGGLLVRASRQERENAAFLAGRQWPFAVGEIRVIKTTGDIHVSGEVLRGSKGAFIAWADEELARASRQMIASINDFYTPDPAVVARLLTMATERHGFRRA